ncbi:MAG: uroporphyrinogen-III synthase [Candidatus Rhabdochlamydia sp.]
MKHVLYLGLDPTTYQQKHPDQPLLHLPLIEIQPIDVLLAEQCDLTAFTHLIVTSPRAADLLIKQQIFQFPLEIISVGQRTTERFLLQNIPVTFTALQECQEGIISHLDQLFPEEARILYPRSFLARALLANYLEKRGFFYQVIDLYHVQMRRPQKLPDLNACREVVFTSPSTVASFFCAYASIPSHLRLTCIGPVTQLALDRVQKEGLFFKGGF